MKFEFHRNLIEKTVTPTGVKYSLNLEMIFIPLQIIFVILKLTGVINWSWVKVFIPVIIMVSWIVFFLVLGKILYAIALHNNPWYQLNKLCDEKEKKENKKHEKD